MFNTTNASHFSPLSGVGWGTISSVGDLYNQSVSSNVGETIINGNLKVNGNIYTPEDEDMKKEIHDINIEAVDNGYLIRAGINKYVFCDMESLLKWMDENLKTLNAARTLIYREVDLKSYYDNLLNDTSYTTGGIPYTTNTTYTKRKI